MNFYIPLSAFFLESGTQSFSSSLDNDLVTSISRFSYNFLRLFLLITTPATKYHWPRLTLPPAGPGPGNIFLAPPPAGPGPTPGPGRPC